MPKTPYGTDTLPPPLMTSDEGSFAQDTFRNRLPAMLDDLIRQPAFPVEIRASLAELKREITHGLPVRRLAERTPDRPTWDEVWSRFIGRSWLRLPWYPAEAYFYRRILEATRYFQPGPWQGVDPFGPQKRRELAPDSPTWESLGTALERLPVGARPCLSALLLLDLWGNRADLSITEIARSAHAGLSAQESQHLLMDHRPQVIERFESGKVRRVDFILDNAGLELLFDLVLADHLLTHWNVQCIRLHLKPQPFFVSDAMPVDVQEALQGMRRWPKLAPIASRLEAAQARGRLELLTDPFWISAYGHAHMPAHLYRLLGEADLVIIKGDANYRRLLDDRRWPATDSLEERTRYFPAPFVCLRTAKAELVLDMTEERVRELEARDPRWRVNGQYGLIRLCGGARGLS
ncbi:MAG: damage-control phosphatase ARMT1 family protein [Anaerolineae bacterium]